MLHLILAIEGRRAALTLPIIFIGGEHIIRSIILSALLVLTVTTLEAQEHKITVMSWNVENLFDTVDDPSRRDEEFTPDGSKNWTEEKLALKMSHIAEVIQSVTSANGQKCPDFIGFSEIENAQVLQALNRKYLKDCEYDKIVIDPKDPDPRGIRTAGLTRLKVPYKPKSHAPYSGARFILEIPVMVNGQLVTFFLNHWKSRLSSGSGSDDTEARRITYGKTLKKRVLDILKLKGSADLIAMGDFNDEPENKSFKEGLGSTMNIRTLFDNLGTFVFWNPSADLLRLPGFEDPDRDPDFYKNYRMIRATYYYSRGKAYNQFDNFHLSPGLFDEKGAQYIRGSYRVVRHKKYSDSQLRPIPFDARNNWKGASDHFPIALDLNIFEQNEFQ